MSIVLTANLTPAGNFPIVTTEVISGGYQTVANIAARDAIQTPGVDSAIALDGFRRNGMLVYTQSTGQRWILGPGLTNADWALDGGGVSGSYRTSFTDANLVVGVLTVFHGLGVNFNTYAIYDNLNFSVLNPDSVLNVNANTIAIDLSTYQIANGGAIPGTWNVVVQS